jgi:HAE1 family hydrophobic/amphiphilic exporter-1
VSLPVLCVRRPIATILLWTCVVVLGALAWSRLPVSALPRYETPTIEVKGRLAGASPSTIATSVATPMEKEFSAIEGLVSSSSQSVVGETEILLEFDSRRDIDAAAVDVQAALFRVNRYLPSEMSSPPEYKKVNPGDAPILKLSLWSPSLSMADLNDYIEDLVVPAISQINGVAQVAPKGRKRYALRVEVDPQQLAALDLSLEEVSSALKRATSNTAMGQLDNERQTLVVEVQGGLQRAADFADVVIAHRNGAQVLLSDIATLQDSVEEDQNAARVNGTRSIVLEVRRQPGANITATVDQIRRLIPMLQSQLPSSIQIEVMGDRSASVREAIHDVNITLVLTVVMVVIVIALFLRNLPMTLIPSIAIPVSLLATFAIMQALGLSLNNVSLMALTIAVGLVVDDAIVVIENIHSKLGQGATLVQAAMQGSSEVAFTLVSISLSLVVVFIPIMFMPDAVGLLFREFALVVSVAVIASMFVALTLIPALAPRLIRSSRAQASHAHDAPGLMPGVLSVYARLLDLALRRRGWVLGLGGLSLLLTATLYVTAPKGFFPQEDTGQLTLSIKTDQAISYEGRVAVTAELDRRLASEPALHRVVSQINRKGIKFEIDLKPRSERDAMPEVVARLRKSLSGIPGASVSVTAVQNLKVGASSSDSPYEYIMRAVGSEVPHVWAEKMQWQLQHSGVFEHVDSDAEAGALQAELVLDARKMASLGVDMAALRQTLSYAFGQREVATIYSSQASYKVIMQLASDDRRDESDLGLLRVRSTSGQMIPVEAFAKVVRSRGQSMVAHRAQLPAVTLSFALADGKSLSDAQQAIADAERELQFPPTVFGTLGGQAALYEDSSTRQVWLVLAAVAAIYVILGVLYESWFHPLTILVGVPSASLGALLALRLLGMEITFVAMVGILLLVGVVKKNAILLVDFALEARSRGLGAEDAVRQACMQRFRPILMTSLCTLVGALPLALALGAGAELRQPMGVAVVGGLAVSLLVTLFLTPVVYVCLDRFSGTRPQVG